MEERKGSFGFTIAMIALGLAAVAILAGMLVAGPERVGQAFDKIGTGLQAILFGIGVLFACAGLAKVVHNWRIPERPAPVVEHHYHHDGTTREVRILDGRAPAQTDVRLLQLPNSGMGGMPNIWPALMAGAAQWGAQNATGAELPRPAEDGAGPDDGAGYGATFDEEQWNGVIR